MNVILKFCFCVSHEHEDKELLVKNQSLLINLTTIRFMKLWRRGM